MKLADIYDLDGLRHSDVNLRAPLFVRDQLAATGLDELACYDWWDDEVRRFFIATPVGLFVATFTPRRDIRFEPKIEATVTPWANVSRVLLSIEGFIGDDATLSVEIEEPAFRRTAERQRDWKVLSDFARTCLEQQGKVPGSVG